MQNDHRHTEGDTTPVWPLGARSRPPSNTGSGSWSSDHGGECEGAARGEFPMLEILDHTAYIFIPKNRKLHHKHSKHPQVTPVGRSEVGSFHNERMRWSTGPTRTGCGECRSRSNGGSWLIYSWMDTLDRGGESLLNNNHHYSWITAEVH